MPPLVEFTLSSGFSPSRHHDTASTVLYYLLYSRILQIYFPGVSSNIFRQLLMFLYTDEIEPISSTRCLDLIELANRLCLTRLINLIEKTVIDELHKHTIIENSDVIPVCLRLLETCKVKSAIYTCHAPFHNFGNVPDL